MVQRRLGTGLEAVLQLAIVEFERGHGGQIEGLVANRHGPAEGLVAALAAQHREGQVLDRKIAIRLIGRIDPAFHRRIVGFIAFKHHESIPANSSSCSQAACLGARLVCDHSSIISGATRLSSASCSSVPVRTVSSSR